MRSADDYRALYAASRQGNYPLLRTYSGTDDFIRQAELFVETINILSILSVTPIVDEGRGDYDAFVQRVQLYAGLERRQEAARLIEIVLATLGERL